MWHSDLDFKDMTLVNGYNTPSGHGQQLCITFQIQYCGKEYCPDTDLGIYVHIDLGVKNGQVWSRS